MNLILLIMHIDIDTIRIVIVPIPVKSSTGRRKEEKKKKRKQTVSPSNSAAPASRVRLIFTGYCSNWMLPRKPGYSKSNNFVGGRTSSTKRAPDIIYLLIKAGERKRERERKSE